MRRILGSALVGMLAVATAACGGRQDTASTDTGGAVTCEVAGATRIGIATGNATGVYFALGNAYAEQINAVGGNLQATAAETGASVQNIQQLVAGTYDVAFSLADTAADAVNGTGSFTEKQKVAALSRIHSNYTQVIVRKAAGISDVAGMKGKRVSTGSPKSGTEVIANRLLTAAGLQPDTDVQAQKLDLTKTVDGMKDGTIDALFWSGGLPTPGITDLLTTGADQVEFLDITPLLPEMRRINEVYREGVIPAATYRTPADVKTIVVPNVLLVREDLDPNVACVLTRTLFDRKAQLEQANAAAKEITLETARQTTPVTLHRGATKALDDLGAPK
ncbi:C4-dicarboxylate ABC transporter substrate-binding protein [Actinoplanes lobatus]|uniref:C4-dicarboxylate ABC transporter substrate-binding protein n=1 Tax=Actinoplanes lobatus TaxID=113568 RepID=A0A7W7HQF5_9ACTN|nr:TAXI family TRAP transporter solute-binding subunit [Actinoplanes lobatus]MBB4754823.1 TRAP transporter TAXI family solute receptor [Actinoplanes lobatus]GGN81611.1 C4-dicarboxylate ABC transporter substrate-binding protein [Actinoplanes lobatus]GIE43047.1 C4-dicarboxylate ABC transporter substrate-binding protein [Actinoplanes lobatus]